MKRWFGKTINEEFTAFSTDHVIMLGICVAGLLLLVLNARIIRESDTVYTLLRWSLLGVLIISEVSYQTWAAVNGVWNVGAHLPLHLCGIASLFGMAALITRHYKLIQLTLFIGIIPSFMALLTPEIPYNYEHFRYWKFFIHHMAIPWTSVFLLVTSSVKVSWKNALEAYGYLVAYSILVSLYNVYFGSNYLYLAETPLADTPLDLLGGGVLYYLNLGILALLSFFLTYGLYHMVLKKV
ncbi:TIGR02206 family membrane protein [Thalassobacillus sp. CUG 92003]|uniref:YwaF family protein n=1 Tax=Thalassobacillus sp. CUG 92003 TaxID=2736641 RepID=UPI0015E6D73A|nr:TIGR02206 family membrane protein [Thalassobacillus sp. CUG 92003]